MPKLIIVPTPIGNLGDMTYRAVEVLQRVGLILAEDTRTSGHLLRHFGIETPMRPYHSFNEHRVVDRLVDEIVTFEEVALISDAGTPGISDPGYLLIRACLDAGIALECLPGATSVIPALVASGFPSDRFIYEGFLPHKKGRMKRLEALKDEDRTILFLESPHRIVKAIRQMAEVFGDQRQVVIARELTKIHEELIRGTLAEVAVHFEAHAPKGEMVVVVTGRSR